MQLGFNGLTLLKHFEGCRLKPYKDIAGKWTIGFGHMITSSLELSKYINGITQAQADELLISDSARFVDACNRLIKVSVSQLQFDALVCFDYNTGALNSSTLLKTLNDKQFNLASAQFVKWDHFMNPKTHKLEESQGLYRRRLCEKFLFDGGTAEQLAKEHNWFMEVVHG